MFVFLTAVFVALFVSLICSICEAVLLSINHAQVEGLKQRHEVAGRLMEGFKRNIDVPIAAILILNTTAHTIGAAVSGATYSDVFDESTLWLFTIIFTLFMLLFTEIIPKTLGVTFSSYLAAPVAFILRTLTFALKPLVVLSEYLSRHLRGDGTRPVTSVEEIRLLAALGRREGAFGVRTADMIMGATMLRKMRALDIMIPRGRVTFLSASQSREEVMATLHEMNFGRYPFSPSGDMDDTTGVVLARDLLMWMQKNPGQAIDWTQVVTDVLVVPESTLLDDLLKRFQTMRRHLAIVIDEFGGVEGIATLEDVIEEIVGDIEDESDQPVARIFRNRDGTIDVRGSIELRRVFSLLGLDWTPQGEVSTLGGLVTEQLGHIPETGDVLEWRGYRLEIRDANVRRVEMIRIIPTPDS